MENQEKIQDSLTEFGKSPSKDIPVILEDYLRTVAKTGKTIFPWQLLRCLFVQKLEQVMEQFLKEEYCDRSQLAGVDNNECDEMQRRIIDSMEKFNSAPFTVQRLCELVTQPKKHYTKCEKFMRGIEKNVMVVSVVDPHGKKIVCESRVMVNGFDRNGDDQDHTDLNEFTDGQPFAPVPKIGWYNNHATAVWPEHNIGTQLDTPSSACLVDKVAGDTLESGEIVGKSVAGHLDTNTNNSESSQRETTSTDCGVKDNQGSEQGEDNLCTTDCVKLPPSSSLFSHLQRLEPASHHSDNTHGNTDITDLDQSVDDDKLKPLSFETNVLGSDSTDTAECQSDSDMSVGKSSTELEVVENKCEGETSEVEQEGNTVEESGSAGQVKDPVADSDRKSPVKRAPDDGDGPPEKKMKCSEDEETTTPVAGTEQTHDQLSTTDPDAEPSDTKSSDDDTDDNPASEMSESLKEGCLDTDTMPFIPSANDETDNTKEGGDTAKEGGDTDQITVKTDQSGDSVQNETDSAVEDVKNKENKSESPNETAETVTEQSEGTTVAVDNTSDEQQTDTSTNNDNDEQLTNESADKLTSENAESKKETDAELADTGKSQDEAMETECASEEKTEQQTTVDESEPMDHD